MRIKVNCIFEGHERAFFIPCGTGDKPFKWLAITASQRYSNAAPNGMLRRRDDFCGISERAQHQAYSVELESGEAPEPHEFLSDYLHDGDEVTIYLNSKQNIEGINGAPSLSKWTTMAYSMSATGLHPDMIQDEDDEDGDEEFEGGDEIDEMERIAARIAADNVTALKADASFMRLVLQSQMINKKKAAHALNSSWGKIDGRIPQLTDEDSEKVKGVFAENWDLILELFHHYAPNGTMSQEEFAAFLDEAEMFLVVDAHTQISKVYSRTLKYTAADESSFDFSCLLVALVICAQIKYNDTLNSKSGGVKRSYEALFDLFENNFIPLSEHLCHVATLKNEFCADPCMAKTRSLYEDLLTLFNKYAFKTRDVAYTLPCEDVAEVFFKSGLTEKADDLDYIKEIFRGVKSGTIYGREKQANPDDEYPEDEFAFPEFVEAAARAGYRRFFGKEVRGEDLPFEIKDSHPDEGIMLTITECLVKGLECVVNSVNAKPAAPLQKGKKGAGSKPSTATKGTRK